ncbi:MAG: sodium:solute symporter [Planctomycetota bacterium]
MNLAIGEIDATVVVVYLLGVVLFGLWIGRGQRTASGFLLGGRKLPWWGVLFSIVATETSTVTFLSIPGVAFAVGGDLTFLQLTIGYIVGRFIVVWLFLPHYFRGELFTAYQVLDRRFGGGTKKTASVLFLITRNLADGLRLFLTAVVLDQVIGLDLSVCIVIIGLVTIVYTFCGGMKAVVWNDCIQFIVYMLGAAAAAGVILHSLPGGWAQFTQFAAEEGKFRLFDFTIDLGLKYTFWSGLIGGVFLALATHGTDQLMVQRYLAAGNQKGAGRALMISGFVVCAQFAVFLLIGIGLACFYQFSPPATAFSRGDQVFARFIVDHLPVGVTGITVAAVFSAAMSTLSSSLNSSAAAAVNDLYRPVFSEPPSDRHLLNASRAFTVLFGLVQIAVGIAGQGFQQAVIDNVLAIAGFTTGPILGVFFLGVLTKWVSQKSALVGLIHGIGILTAVWWWQLAAWPWFSVIGAATTFIVGTITESLWIWRKSQQA